VLDQVRAMASWHGPGRLARIGAPTTVIHGDQDRLVPVVNGRKLASLIPGARFEELSGVGHLVPHEAGDVLIDAIRSDHVLAAVAP
jgi:pimeloyl-ACP methyl ester carboxylesterase